MRPGDLVSLAQFAASRHKARTLLTMLGIIFGVGAVISMLSIGAGAQAEALQVIDAMGLRNIIVRDKPAEGPALVAQRERSLGLSLRDLDALREVTADVVAASSSKRVRAEHVLSGFGRASARVRRGCVHEAPPKGGRGAGFRRTAWPAHTAS